MRQTCCIGQLVTCELAKCGVQARTCAHGPLQPAPQVAPRALQHPRGSDSLRRRRLRSLSARSSPQEGRQVSRRKARRASDSVAHRRQELELGVAEPGVDRRQARELISLGSDVGEII